MGVNLPSAMPGHEGFHDRISERFPLLSSGPWVVMDHCETRCGQITNGTESKVMLTQA
jgi:hypothetical protein